MLCEVMRGRDEEIIIEPGRSIVGDAKAVPSNKDDVEVLGALFSSGLIKADTKRDAALRRAIAQYRSIAFEIPAPRYVRSLVDGDQRFAGQFENGQKRYRHAQPTFAGFHQGDEGTGLAAAQAFEDTAHVFAYR